MAPIRDEKGRWLAPGEDNQLLPEPPPRVCEHGALCQKCAPPQIRPDFTPITEWKDK